MFKANDRKISLLVSLIAIAVGVNTVFAQTEQTNTLSSANEITFINGKWKDIAAKARKDNKCIFVDAFTTWCGPCQQLKSVTFKDNSAAAYFNNNFINYAVDMEKGEGLELAEKWDVTAYPALLLFTPEGKLIIKQIGYVDGKQLVEFGKQGLARK